MQVMPINTGGARCGQAIDATAGVEESQAFLGPTLLDERRGFRQDLVIAVGKKPGSRGCQTWRKKQDCRKGRDHDETQRISSGVGLHERRGGVSRLDYSVVRMPIWRCVDHCRGSER